METQLNFSATQPPPNSQPEDDLEPETSPPPATAVHRLTRLLRRIGAVVLLCSALTFILQGWTEWSSLGRYFAFLGFTAVTAGVGLFCGLRLKDAKGARTLLGVSAAIIPAHAAQLGAFTYSLTNPETGHLPELLRFAAPSLGLTIVTILIAAAVLLPITLAAFTAFARIEAQRLTAFYLASNALLLLPTRSPTVIALLTAVLLVANLVADRMWFRKHAALCTFEGIVARLTLVLPVTILCGRNFFLYSANDLLTSVLAFALGYAALNVGRMNISGATKSAWTSYGESFSMPCFVLGWCNFANATFAAPYAPLYETFGLATRGFGALTYAVPSFAIIFASSFLATRLAGSIRSLAGCGMTLGIMYQLATYPSFTTAILALLIGVALCVAAFAVEERLLLFLGIANVGFGLLYHLRFAYSLYEMSPWVSLAAIGLTVILGSSYLERHYQRIMNRLNEIRNRLAGWA